MKVANIEELWSGRCGSVVEGQSMNLEVMVRFQSRHMTVSWAQYTVDGMQEAADQ